MEEKGQSTRIDSQTQNQTHVGMHTVNKKWEQLKKGYITCIETVGCPSPTIK